MQWFKNRIDAKILIEEFRFQYNEYDATGLNMTWNEPPPITPSPATVEFPTQADSSSARTP
jgi:hypothetical protein